METETHEPITALATIEQLTPMQLFAPGAMDPLLDRIKAEVRAIETDISTEAGRKAIASLSYKIARTKTFLDERRVELVANEKKRLAKIDAEGRRMREELDALKDEVRKPLTEWEEAEKARIAHNETRIAAMEKIASAQFDSLDTIAIFTRALDYQADFSFSLEFTKRAWAARDKAAIHLTSERQRLERDIAEKLEQDRLRAQAEEKARVEREAKIAEDARLKAEAEAKRREEALAQQAKQREEEQARIAAEDKARLERERKESEERLQKSLDDARAKAQREKLAAEERERKAEENRVATARQAEEERVQARERAEAERERAVADERRRQEDIRKREEDARKAADAERERREKDQAHRHEVQRAAYDELLNKIPNITIQVARDVVKAIAKDLIPGVLINY